MFSQTGSATLDKWSGFFDYTGIADRISPDYELEPSLAFDRPEQYQALFEETRMAIVNLLLERAATVSELADTLDKPKGTVGHHVGVLENAGLIRLVRTEKVRAVEAKYYGRSARTYLLGSESKLDLDMDVAPDHFLATAATEFRTASKTIVDDPSGGPISTLRYVRIPAERARDWHNRLIELAEEFVGEPRSGERTYGLLIAFYPTDRPHLPDSEQG